MGVGDILKKSSVSERLTETFKDLFISRIELPQYLSLDRPFPYVRGTLDLLSKEYNMYLISRRKHYKLAIDELNSIGLSYFFKHITTTKGKDRKETKAQLIRKMNKEQRTVVIGDTEEDIQAAKELRAISIAVLSGIRNENQLRKFRPDYLIENISFLSKILQSLH